MNASRTEAHPEGTEMGHAVTKGFTSDLNVVLREFMCDHKEVHHVHEVNEDTSVLGAGYFPYLVSGLG